MGHWGTAILSNDTAADIKDTFFDLYDKGQTLSDIRIEIEKQFKEGDDLSSNTDLWLTLALLQWQVGQLDNDVKEYAEKIIDQDIDITAWRESEADEKSLTKRKAELVKLKEKLQTSNPKPRKPKKKIAPKSILPKGDVYAFPLENGDYSVVIVLEEIISPDYYFVLLALTNICKKEIPTLEDVYKSKLLAKPIYNDDKTIRPTIASFTNSKHKEIIKSFLNLGNVSIKEDYQKNYLSFGAAPWTFLLEWAKMYLVDHVPRPSKNFQVSDYIKVSGN
ncbi:MAG: immunity 26/phosphotriesterase HocA family protein [Bacteriodetes bacterium]|nr:immunity 26/phosphotriesterase HocA family protein [Bacteroidota bacterium]